MKMSNKIEGLVLAVGLLGAVAGCQKSSLTVVEPAAPKAAAPVQVSTSAVTGAGATAVSTSTVTK